MKPNLLRDLLLQLEQRLLEHGADQDRLGCRYVVEGWATGNGGVRLDLWDSDDRRAPVASARLDAQDVAAARASLANRSNAEAR